ncbi:MAG: DUF983 domain-containing protein [Anditalea sp.]
MKTKAMGVGKGSKIYSIVECKCPKCHEGDMFAPGTLYHPTKFYKMHAYCAYCDQSFEPEPGFYFGSMFVSYAINTALFIIFWIATSFLVEDMSLLMILGILFAVVIFLLPITFRLSRSIWINFFVHYDPKAIKNAN